MNIDNKLNSLIEKVQSQADVPKPISDTTIFSEYREGVVVISEKKSDEASSRKPARYECVMLEMLYQFGYLLSMQLYSCTKSKLQYRNLKKQRFKESLLKLVKSGYATSFVLKNSENESICLYMLTLKGLEYCETRYAPIYAVLWNKMNKELTAANENVVPSSIIDKLILNQFIVSCIVKTNVVNYMIGIELSRLELSDKLKMDFLPALIRVSFPKGSEVLGLKHHNGTQSNRTLTVFPLVLGNELLDQSCIMLLKQFFSINAYARYMSIRRYFTIVIVPSVSTALHLHQMLLELQDTFVLSHFYLLDTALTYSPLNNLFAIEDGCIKQFSLLPEQ